jgi:hypothetical protein
MHTVTNTTLNADGRVVPWNKGKLIDEKPPLKLKEIWAIRIRLRPKYCAALTPASSARIQLGIVG